MLVAALVCPHPPVLVPAVANAVADQVAPLRAACLDGVRRLTSTDAADVVAVGGGPAAGEWGGSAGGGLAAFGVDVRFGGSDQVLPLSLAIGAALLDDIGWRHDRRRYVAVTDTMSPEECARVGTRIVSGEGSVAMLVLGDGSAKRTPTSPGYVDARATGYDQLVVTALQNGDVDTLLGLSPELARELWVAGRPAWQVLAGAARTAQANGASIKTAVRYDEAPFGVGYAVVDWTFGPD